MGFSFNARQVPPAVAGSEPLPIGEWPMQITGANIKPNNDNKGGALVFDVVIIGPEHTGQTGFYRLNLFNDNQKTVEIAQRQLSSLCHAVGIYEVTDATLGQFVGKQFIGVVKSNATEQYPKGTQIGGVKDVQGNDPGRALAGQALQAPTQPPSYQPSAPAVQTQPAAQQAPSWNPGAAVPAFNGQQSAQQAPVQHAWAQQPAAPNPPWPRNS